MAKLFQWTRWRSPWLKCRSARLKQAHLLPLVVIVSDGEANIPLVPGADVERDLLSLAAVLKQERLESIIVDSSNGPRGSALLRQLATAMEGRYQHIRDLHGGRLFEMLRSSKKRDNTKNEMD